MAVLIKGLKLPNKNEILTLYIDGYGTVRNYDRLTKIGEAVEVSTSHGRLIDARTIIKCDECKHWDTEWIPAIGDGHYCPMMDHVMVGDEWCCYAERRETDG